MGIIDIASALLGGGTLGSILGIIGTVITKADDAKKRRDDLRMAIVQGKQTKSLMELEHKNKLEMAQLDSASRERIAAIDAGSRADEQAGLSQRASYDHDTIRYMSAQFIGQSRFARVLLTLVDFMRGVVRPGATVYALVLMSHLIFWAMGLYEKNVITITPDVGQKIVLEITYTATTLITTIVLWWFGGRPTQHR